MKSKLCILRRGKARYEDQQRLDSKNLEAQEAISRFCTEVSNGSGSKVKSLDLNSLMPDFAFSNLNRGRKNRSQTSKL